MSSHVSTTYGVVRDSILNTSRYFHVTEGLAPDIMHDVLEGCLQYEAKELIKYIVITQKFISLSALNSMLDMFPYGCNDVLNKPTPITSTCLSSSDHNLKQSGMSMYYV